MTSPVRAASTSARERGRVYPAEPTTRARTRRSPPLLREAIVDDANIAISPRRTRFPARGRSLMVARLVTLERDLRLGPFARSGVRLMARGRRPELPPVRRVSAYVNHAPAARPQAMGGWSRPEAVEGRWRRRTARGPMYRVANSLPAARSASPEPNKRHQERDVGCQREQAKWPDERCAGRPDGERQGTSRPAGPRRSRDPTGSRVRGRRCGR